MAANKSNVRVTYEKKPMFKGELFKVIKFYWLIGAKQPYAKSTIYKNVSSAFADDIIYKLERKH